MNHGRFFGQYVAARSPIHAWPVWVKYLLMFVGGVVPFLVGQLWVSLTALIFAAVLLVAGAGIPARRSLVIGWQFWMMMLMLAAYHWLMGDLLRGVLYLINLLAAIYLARLVTMTTPINDIMDAIAGAVRPLRFLGVDPERVALAFVLMWRSIPHLIGLLGQVRESARARGLSAFSLRYLIPTIVSAVGFALTTSDALRARGLEAGD